MVLFKRKTLHTQICDRVLVTQSCLALCYPMDYRPSASVYPWDLPDPGMETWSHALQADSLPSEAPAKPYMIKISHILRYQTSLYFRNCCFSSVEIIHCEHNVGCFYLGLSN